MSQAPAGPKESFSGSHFAESYKAQRQDTLFYSLMAFVLAVVEILALYLAFSIVYQTPPLESCLGRVPDTGLPWFTAALLSRGILQPLNLMVFAFAANTLGMRLFMMRRESRAFLHSFFEGIPIDPQHGLRIEEEARAIPLVNVQRIEQECGSPVPLLVRRLEIGARRLAEGGDTAEIHDVMKALSDIDRENLESRFTLVRYIIWLIPTIGFLGTVIGIGVAITQFSSVMAQVGEGTEDFQTRLQGVLGEVASNLGVAFDTTMLALLLSAFLVALTSIVQTREEGLLFGIDEFCLRYFVSRIAVAGSQARTIQQVMVGLAAITQSMETMAKRSAAKDGKDSMTLRDIAGLIEGQPARIKQAIAEVADKDSRAAQRLADAMASAADRIQQAVQNLQAPGGGARPDSNKPPSGQASRI
ncbi:MAG: MotA/TolQ/ExbB proton channel family protein [Planctomycetota bacterium]|nr:MotA/TolQ/ExbB proton channel family protein [Planctomycetota bacterium]